MQILPFCFDLIVKHCLIYTMITNDINEIGHYPEIFFGLVVFNFINIDTMILTGQHPIAGAFRKRQTLTNAQPVYYRQIAR